MSMSHPTIRISKDQPILRRRRQRKAKPLDMDKVQRDFWKTFNLEKFASDWRRGVGRRDA